MRSEKALKNKTGILPLVLTLFPWDKLEYKNIYLSFSGWLHETWLPKERQPVSYANYYMELSITNQLCLKMSLASPFHETCV